MSIPFEGLPFDIFFSVTSHLSFDDILSLGHSCRRLRQLLHESTLCRRTVETHMRLTQEAQQARDHCQRLVSTQDLTKKEEHGAYIEATRSIHEKRHAFTECLPFSARVVGQAHSFYYRQGTLCMLEGTTLRVLDVSHPSRNVEIDLRTTKMIEDTGTPTGDYDLSLLFFNDDIAAIYYEKKTRLNQGSIFAVSTKRELANGKRVLRKIIPESSYKLFVRHTSDWLYYGTHTAMGSNGHHEWEMFGVPLKDGPTSPKHRPRVQLDRFFGRDFSSTIAFEVRNGYFYAVTNQTSFDLEEIDWTSFYHCIQFPLDYRKPSDMKINRKVYRRQHAEGPIHDSWTDLSIQFDDITGDAKIVESRREWMGSSSRQLRAFYITDFNCEPKPTLNDEGGPEPAPEVPENDLFTTVLDCRNKPNYAPEQERLNPAFHPELPPDNPPDKKIRTFILARTKVKAYNLSTNCFLDLVEDERCCYNPTPCLRLRVGSRREAPLDWTNPGQNYAPSQFPGDYLGPRGDVLYRHSDIKMWPPSASKCACSKRLHGILNPPLPSSPGSPSYNRSFEGSVDEHGLVYMLRPSKQSSSGSENSLGVLVMVRFSRDPPSVSPPPTADGTDTTSTGHHGHARQTAAEDASYWQWQRGMCKKGLCC